MKGKETVYRLGNDCQFWVEGLFYDRIKKYPEEWSDIIFEASADLGEVVKRYGSCDYFITDGPSGYYV